MLNIETPEDFLRIFFPTGNVDNIWNDIVNSSFYQVRRSVRTYGSVREVFREDDYSEKMSEESK